MDIGLVEYSRALGLRQDKIGKKCQAEVGIEWEPTDDEIGPIFEEGEEGEDDPVHEPWGKESGIGGAESFIRGEDGEQDGKKGARSL